MDQDPLDDEVGLDDDAAPADQPTIEVVRPQRRPIGRRGLSVPGAVAGAILITAMALGATTRFAATGAGGSGADGDAAARTADTGSADGSGGESDGAIGEPDGNPDATPGADGGDGSGDGPDATEPAGEPGDGDGGADGQPASEPTPAPAPDQLTIAIALHLGTGKVTIEWGPCPVDGFVAWKVVRSLDGNPTWPLGVGDELVAASENQGLGSVANGDLPAGRTVSYRVVGLGRLGDETIVRCRSRIADIHIPAAEPTPDPTTEPDRIGSIGLTLTLTDGGKPRADWTTCVGDWDVTKVVRSTNDGVTFPLGSDDSDAGVFGKDGPTAMTDSEAAADKAYWYRVFCVRHAGDGYVVVAVSPTRKITTPAAEPQPEPTPVGLDLSVELTDGGVALHWGACTNDHFVAYKVVRSAGPNPSYLPLTDGSTVIAVKEDAGVVSFTDPNVESGQTWNYRVQCIGWMNDHKILLGETDVATVTLP